MSSFFARTFRQAIAEGRHELLGGWFGRHFEPHPMQAHADPASERERSARVVESEISDLYGHAHER